VQERGSQDLGIGDSGLLASTLATAIGWLMQGLASAPLRRWSRCLLAAKALAVVPGEHTDA